MVQAPDLLISRSHTIETRVHAEVGRREEMLAQAKE